MFELDVNRFTLELERTTNNSFPYRELLYRSSKLPSDTIAVSVFGECNNMVHLYNDCFWIVISFNISIRVFSFSYNNSLKLNKLNNLKLTKKANGLKLSKKTNGLKLIKKTNDLKLTKKNNSLKLTKKPMG